MKKILLLVLVSVISVNAQWFTQVSGTTNILNSLYFINENTGFVVGFNGTLLKTVNGGLNWIQYSTGTGYHFMSIYFKDTQTGFIVGYGQSDYTLMRTTNTGLNWTTQMSIPNNYQAHSIVFKNALTGFISGKGIPYKTTDGGNSWSVFQPGLGTGFNYLRSSFKANENNIYWAGHIFNPPNGGQALIYYTTNGGTDFIERTVPSSQLQDISFGNESNGFVVGLGYLGRTTDAGANWTYINSPPLYGSSVSYSSLTNVYNAASYDIYFSANGGLNWSVQHHETNRILNYIKMVNVNTGYAVGYDGLILKTINGGVIGIHPISTEIPNQFSLSQNYPNPFNPSTKIQFALPKSSFATIVIYDALGRELETLVNEQLNAGTYEADWSGDNFSSSVYYYKLTTGDYSETKKMVLVK